ncbi:MAG: rRNA adenine N-6-methyltransferase family protein [Dehalococcoidia bacterium]
MPSESRPAQRVALSYHRLASPEIARRIVASTGLAPPCHVLDLGAGEGMLTAALLERGFQVTAIEADAALVRELNARFARHPRLTVIHGDLFAIPEPSGPYAIVATHRLAGPPSFSGRLPRLPLGCAPRRWSFNVRPPSAGPDSPTRASCLS